MKTFNQLKKVVVLISIFTLFSPQFLPITAVAAGSGTGLWGDYYNEDNLGGDIVHKGVDVGHAPYPGYDGVFYIDWQEASPAQDVHKDNFSVKWTGWIEPLYTANYVFHTNTDDGAVVLVDGKTVTYDWTPVQGGASAAHNCLTNSSAGARNCGHNEFNRDPIYLTANTKYSITIKYHEIDGAALMALMWESDPDANGNRQAIDLVPISQLYPASGSPSNVQGGGYACTDAGGKKYNSGTYKEGDPDIGEGHPYWKAGDPIPCSLAGRVAKESGFDIKDIFGWAIGIGSIAALGVITFGGLKYTASGLFGSHASATEIEGAKEWIFAGLKGLGLLIAAYLILNVINANILTF